MALPPFAATAVDKILAFVDKPWKLAAIVVLAATLVSGVTLWEKRGELAEAVLEGWMTPRLEPGRFPKLAARLISETGVDLVELAEISPHTNLIRNIDGVRRGNPGWEPQKNPRQLIAELRPPSLVISFIEGRIICADIDPQDGTEEQDLARLGLKRRCFIGVPPVLDVLVGGLQIAWRERPSPEAEAGAGQLLYQAASQLATW